MDPDTAVELGSWLAALGLAEYAPQFAAQGITPDLLPQLDDADLKELGVALLGHRKRLRAAIAALVQQPVPPPPPAAPARDAERRQLTVMFCDLVGSTQLAGQLDPEDLQGVIRTYHAAVADAVAPFAGHVAQLLGDGCLVYFGYPQAHEDDAARALHAALAVLAAVAALPARAGAPALQTRIGIATGRVVVGEVGAGTAAAEQTASGETPNLAARLQAQAAPGEVVLSDETRRLVGSAFDLEAMGALTLKGFAAPVPAWRMRGERSVATRFEAQHESALIDFVGRASEVALLVDRWQLARDGEGQVVLLSGEAGIGKSRIVQMLRERISGERHATILMQCSPYHGSSALYPLVQYFERATGIVPADPPEVRAGKLERLIGASLEIPAAARAQLLRLLGAAGGEAPQLANPQQEKAQTLQAPVDLLRVLARQVPVLMLIEDVHWIDPTTSELIALTIEQSRDARLLVLVTSRPEFVAPWGNAAHLTRLALNRLGQRQSVELVTAVAGGRALPDEVLAQIIARTDGIPLFVEELTKTVLESGLLVDTPQGWRLRGPLPPLAIPSTLQDSLMSRLDRLAPAKEVAQVGAIIGREFPARLLGAVLRMAPDKLAQALDELVRAELVQRRGVPPDEVYVFRHALIRDTAYNSLLKGQRALRHAQIAVEIAALEPDAAASRPELLAYHCQEGGQGVEAFGYWRAAGDRAVVRIAGREAALHYRAALALLPALDASAREAAELDVQARLGNVLMQTEGYSAPQTMACFTRARELAQQLGRVDDYVAACAAFGASLWGAGRYEEELAMLGAVDAGMLERLRPMSRVIFSVVLGLLKYHLGDLVEAAESLAHTRRELATIAAADRVDISGVDARVVVLTQSVALSVQQGRLDDADAYTDEAMRVAQDRGHPPTRAWALSLARWKAFRHGDWDASIRIATESLALSEQLGFRGRIGAGRMLLGRALVAAGRADEGARLLHDGYALWSADGSYAGATEFAASSADVLLEAGRIDDAQAFVAIGEQAMAAIPERLSAAELARLRGRLDQIAGDAGAAEAQLRRALALAERQGAGLYTLRAARDVAQLLGTLGRAAEGAALLRPALAALPQGHDQPDALRARATLQALERGA